MMSALIFALIGLHGVMGGTLSPQTYALLLGAGCVRLTAGGLARLVAGSKRRAAEGQFYPEDMRRWGRGDHRRPR